MPTIKYTIDTSWSGRSHTATFQVDDEDLEGLSPEERADAIAELVEESVQEKVSWNWEEVS